MAYIGSAACLDADRNFGPIVQGSCRDGFDFTLFFEQAVLTIAPISLLLLLAPLRICWLHKSNSVKTTSWDSLLRWKALAITHLLALQLALLVLWSMPGTYRTPASLPAATLGFIGTLALYPLSYVTHCRSIQPSSLIVSFLLASSLLDILQARTLFLRQSSTPIAALFTLAIGTKLALLVLESRDKRIVLKPPYNEYPYEATSGVVQRSILLWLSPLFVEGYKGVLSVNKLCAIDPALSSGILRDRMQLAWDQRRRPEGPHTLLLQVAKVFWWPMLQAVPLRLSMIIFYWGQILLIRRAIKLIEDEEQATSNTRHKGVTLIIATSLVYIGPAVANVLFRSQINRIIAMLRAALVGIIFNKALTLHDAGDDSAAALTLMSADIDRIVHSSQFLNEIWAALISMSIGILILSKELGPPILIVPITVLIIVFSIISIVSSRRMNKHQKLWSQAIQKRIDLTGSMLGHMTAIRMMGLTGFMTTRIQTLRLNEIIAATIFRWLNTRTGMLANIPPIFGPVLTFLFFELYSKNDHLSTSQAFTCLATISLMTERVAALLDAIPRTVTCVGNFQRIQKFLLIPSRVDYRIRTDTSDTFILSEKKGSDADIEFVLNGENVQEKADHAIEITNLTVRPAPIAKPAVFNINIQLRRATITFLAGPIGSGKSTLIRAILGELPFDTGSIQVSSPRMAYCSQNPWLHNATIREIICGSQEYPSLMDRKWYDEVKRACALDEDILNLADGDDSVVGSRGITLSGGQKQRMALARAIYTRRNIILLDDVLSALDSTTESLVVDRLLGEDGLFRKHNSTVLLITHTTRHFQLADHIIVLSGDGKIAHKGTFDDLKSHIGYLSSLLLVHGQHSIPQMVSTDSLPLEPFGVKNSSASVTELTCKRGDFSVYRYYINSIGWRSFFLFVVLAAVLSGLSALPQIWLASWVDSDGEHIVVYFVLYAALGFSIFAFRGATLGMIYFYIAPKVGLKLHSNLLQTTMSAPHAYHAETDAGMTLNRFSQDVAISDRDVTWSIVSVSLCLFACIAGGVTIMFKSPYMSAPVLVLAAALFYIQKVYLLTSRQMRFLDLEARGPVYSHFLETIEGLSTIRAFGWQESSQASNIQRLDDSQKPYYLLYCVQQWLSLVLNLLVAAIAITVVALPVVSEKIRQSMTGSAVGVILTSILPLAQSLSSLIEGWTWLETSMGAVSRLKRFGDEVLSEDKPWEKGIPPMEWPNKGHIEFQEVYASYGPTAPALRGISMSIEPGQKVGICGRTGSGKSSLLLTLLRLLEIDTGTIFIDGIDIQNVKRGIVRSRLIVIPQSPFIINSTVRQNADPTGLVADHVIIEALTKIKLWNILHARGGLDAQMRAEPLSQGQQQLFCLARALLKKREGGAKILVLDEATSNVDAETDQLMQRVIREEFKEHTIITVAHRIDTILDADRVAVLEGGRVLEFGEPTELLGREESRFRELCGGCY